MQKPLDPLSVDKAETPSASYVLRRRYGPMRYLVAVAGWVTAISLLLQPVAAWAGTVTWDNGGDQFSWGDGSNWSPSNTEPGIGDEVVLPATYSGTKTLSNGETANSITVGNNTYTLSGGDLTLGNVGQTDAGKVDVYSGRTFTINSTLAGTSGITKTSAGTLTLGGVNLLTGGIQVNGGILKLSVGTAFGNNPLTFNGGNLTLDAINYFTREWSGSTTSAANYNQSVYMNSLNDTSADGTIGTSNAGMGFRKTGPGTLSWTSGTWYARNQSAAYFQIWRGGLTLSGTGAIGQGFSTASIDLYNGTLTIDETEVVPDRIYAAAAIKLFGGNTTFRYKGNGSADSAETVAALTRPASTYGVTATIDVRPGSDRNATLTFASYDVAPRGNDSGSVDAIVNFKTGAGNTFGTDAKVLFTTVPELWNGVLMSGFVNGTDFATYESATPNGIMAFGSTGSGTSYVIPTDINTPASTDTVLIDETATTLALTASKRYNALKIDGARTLDLGGNTLSIGQDSGTKNVVGLNAMIVKTGSGEAVIASTPSGGLNNVDQSDIRADEYQFYVNEGVLKVTAPVLAAVGFNLWLRLNKAGPGLLWLDPVANWPGTSSGYGSGIYFSEGAIRLDPDSGAFGNQLMVLNGGVMEIEGGGTYAPTIGTGNANLRWQSSGGFAAYGANATVSPNITWNAASNIPDGAALLLNSTTADKKITLSGTLNLGTDAAKMYLREIEVADNTGSTADLAEISGQIISDNAGTPTYTYHLVKTGAGTLILSNADNNYSGATYVKAGTLLVNGQLDAPASTTVALNPDYSAVTVMSGGALGGSGTITRNVRFEAGSAMAVNAAVAKQLTVVGAVVLDGSPDLTIMGGPLTQTSYTLLSATSITGTFDDGTVPEGYVIRYTPAGAPTTVKIEKPTGRLFIVR